MINYLVCAYLMRLPEELSENGTSAYKNVPSISISLLHLLCRC